jgi:HEAT repeat protein
MMGPNNVPVNRSSLDPEVISLLTSSALNDPDPSVRQEATFALCEHEGNDVTAALLALFNQSKDEQIRLTILYRMTPRRAADARVREKLNDLALHETSDAIRTAAIELLSKHLDEATINQLITIYRSATSATVRTACLRGLSATDSKTGKEFLISIAKQDPDPQLRKVALRAITGESAEPQEFVVNGRHIAVPPDALQEQRDALQQQSEAYRRSVDGISRLRDDAGIVITRRVPGPIEALPPQNRFFFLAPHFQEREQITPRPVPPDSPRQLPEEPKVDPSPQPSPSVSE